MFQFVNLQPQETFVDNTQYTPCNKTLHPTKICLESRTCPEQSKTLLQLGTCQELPGAPVATNTLVVGGFAENEGAPAKAAQKSKSKGDVDTSSFSIEERLVAAVWVHERARMRVSIGQIKRDFKLRFDKEPPTKNTLLIWEKKLFATGNVMDAKRSGRPCQRKEHIQAVQASVAQSPGLSLRARAAALALPRTTLRTILSRDLRVGRPRRPERPPAGMKAIKKPSEQPKIPPKSKVNRQPPSNRQPPHNRPPQPHHQQQPELLHNPPPNPMTYHGYNDLVVPMHLPEFHPYMGYPNHVENKSLHQTTMAPMEHQHYVVGSVQGNHVL